MRLSARGVRVRSRNTKTLESSPFRESTFSANPEAVVSRSSRPRRASFRASFSAADSSSRALRPHHYSRRVRDDRTRAHPRRSRPPRATPGGEPSEGTPGGRALAMAEVKPEEGEPGAEGEEVVRKEHDVSIVLSFMNDEHEKVAIEVRRGKRRRMRARALDEPSGFLRVAALRPRAKFVSRFGTRLGTTNQRFTPTFASFAATFDFRDVRSSRRRGRV